MKIEKINDDKIKITFDYIDLQENNIDFHSFMANSTQTQALFLKILDQAEESLGFNTDQYKLEINTLALSNGIFILIVTRLQKETKKKVVHVHTKRKSNINNPTFSIYKFNSFCRNRCPHHTIFIGKTANGASLIRKVRKCV